MKYRQTETTFKARICRFSKLHILNAYNKSSNFAKHRIFALFFSPKLPSGCTYVDDVDDDDDEIEDSDWEVDWSLGVATSQDVPLRRCVLLCLAPQYDSM